MSNLQSLTSLHPWLAAAVGGVLIGLSTSLMIAFNGRITGLSGIISTVVITPRKARSWRWSFIIGLMLGGLFLLAVLPNAYGEPPAMSAWKLAIAGVLVGFGTRLGGGCTSGHGICGVSRSSPRSIVATFMFVFIGMLTASLARSWGLL